MNLKYIIKLTFFFSLVFAFQIPGFDENQKEQQFKPQIEFNKNISNFAIDQTIDENKYIVGPGDQFSFNMVSTSKVITLSLQVSPTGILQIPTLGGINIDGLLLIHAYSKVKTYCVEKYPNSKINIHLEKVRQIKVNVVGAIDFKISQLTLTSTQRVSDIYEIISSKIEDKNKLLHYGELSKEKEPEKKRLSSRNILLIRDDVVTNIDLDQYFILGKIDSNPYLLQNDIIKFHYSDKFIGIYGGVINEGKYEFIKSDNLSNIIQMAGGLSSNADNNYIEISRFNSSLKSTKIYLNKNDNLKNITLKEFDHVYIRKIQNYKLQELITVEGEINFPGIYSISDEITTIGALIEKCGGVTEIGDAQSIIINNILIEQTEDPELRRITQIPTDNRSNAEISYIKARNGITKGLIRSSNTKFTQSIYEFTISPGDNIIIPKKIKYIEVIGAVKHPGRYPFLENYTPTDYVQLSGGLTQNSTRKKYIIKHSTGQRNPFTNDIAMESGDIIFIAEKLEYNSWDRFKEWMAIISQISTTIIVIQNIIGG